MQADPMASTPSANGAASPSELAMTCWRQAHEIHSLEDTIAVFRKGMSSLTVENAALRGELASAQADRASRGGQVTEVQLPLDARAPAAGRAAVARALSHVSHATLDHALLMTSELTTNSVRHSGASDGASLLLRIECSHTRIRLEVQDPGHEGVIAVGLPHRVDHGGFGLHLVQLLSERWGAERVAAGGTRVWAELTLASSVELP